MADLLADRTVELPPDDRRRLEEVLPTVGTWCDKLAAVGVAASLQHDDLHDGNVFVGPHGDRLFDWGDASVSHPFGTLLVTLRSIASRGLGPADEQARALARLQDAYLEPWTASYSRAELAAAAPLAMRLASICRALSWHRALAGIPPHDHGEWSGNVGGWLIELLEPNLV
jgi:aminoglycoside phosphotransferase (APT) family kinase protein